MNHFLTSRGVCVALPESPIWEVPEGAGISPTTPEFPPF